MCVEGSANCCHGDSDAGCYRNGWRPAPASSCTLRYNGSVMNEFMVSRPSGAEPLHTRSHTITPAPTPQHAYNVL